MTTPEADSEDDRPPGFRDDRDDYSARGGLWLTPSAKRLFRKRRLMPASPCTCQTLTIATVANTWRTPPPTMEVATMVVGIRGDGRASWNHHFSEDGRAVWCCEESTKGIFCWPVVPVAELFSPAAEFGYAAGFSFQTAGVYTCGGSFGLSELQKTLQDITTCMHGNVDCLHKLS